MNQKTLKKVLIGIFAILLSFNVFVMCFGAYKRSHDNDFKTILPFAFVSVESGSMEPDISKGDLLLIYRVSESELKVGDDITYFDHNELVTHRIVEILDDSLITKGLANKINDAAIAKDSYWGKVILSIPFLGYFLDAVNTLTGSIILIVLIIILCNLEQVLNIYDSFKQNKKINLEFKTLPLVSMVVLISTVMVSPYMTAAKYFAINNEFTEAVAGATYFTANYLSQTGNTYFINGWKGDEYQINIRFRNYENSLLYNAEGEDVMYEFYVEKNNSGSYKTDYTVKIDPAAGTTSVIDHSKFYSPDGWGEKAVKNGSLSENEDDLKIYIGPYVLEGKNYEETAIRFGEEQQFIVTVKAGEGLLKDDKISFKILAATSLDSTFHRELQGEYTFQLAEQGEFLGSREITQTTGSNLVTYEINTNLVLDENVRNIKVTWDTSKLYLNEFDTTSMRILLNYNDKYTKEELDDDGNPTGKGSLILPMQAYSKVKLQFFKRADIIGAGNEEISEIDLFATDLFMQNTASGSDE